VKVLAVLVACSLAQPVEAQPPGASAGAQIEAMAKLDWLAGTWTGEAWVEMQPGQRQTSQVVETVERKLGGLILLVQGVGTEPKADGSGRDIVHDALGVIAYDPGAAAYRFRAWRMPGGYYTDSPAVVGSQNLEWSMETPQGKIRYRIKLDEEKRWFETGEFSRDGTTWKKFFEMKLDRKP
jgi:hypothetical protein